MTVSSIQTAKSILLHLHLHWILHPRDPQVLLPSCISFTLRGRKFYRPVNMISAIPIELASGTSCIDYACLDPDRLSLPSPPKSIRGGIEESQGRETARIVLLATPRLTRKERQGLSPSTVWDIAFPSPRLCLPRKRRYTYLPYASSHISYRISTIYILLIYCWWLLFFTFGLGAV